MEELVSSMITASGTFWLGAAGVYKFAQMPRGPAPEPPATRQGELPRVVERTERWRAAQSAQLLLHADAPCENVPLRRTCVALLAGGALVDHVAFVMSDGTVCGFGGSGGTLRPPFVLREDETIVAVEGAGGDALDRIQFVTSSGRQSPPFGGEGGVPFRLELPDSRSIGGLMITQSVRGWIRQLHGVKDVATAAAEADAVQAAALAAPGFVTHHRARLRTTTLWVGGLLTAYAVLILMVMSPLLLELARGPVAIDQAVIGGRGAEPASLARRYVTLEETRLRGTEHWGTQTWSEAHSFQGRWLRERWFEHRWAALKIPKELELPTLVPRLLDDDERLLVKTSIAQDTGDHLSWVGILSALEPDVQQPGRALTAPVVRGDSGLPRYYLDTCLSPSVIWLAAAVALAIGAYGARMLLSLRLSSHDIVARALLPYTNAEATAADQRRQSIDALIRSIDEEVSEEPNEHGVPHVFEWGTTQVAVTQTWILKASRLGFNAAAVADCPSISRPTRLSRQYIGQERVEVVTVRVENTGRAAGQSSFDVQLTTEEYRRLEASTLNRLQEMRAAIGTQRSQQFGKEFVRELRERQGQEGRFWPLPQQQDNGAAAGQQTPDACMGCSRPSTVKIAKICETCPERAECFCAPSWCHHCVLKWWLTANETKLEVEGDFNPVWQARCPTCRNYFCLNDVLPLEGVPILDEEDEDNDANDSASAAQANIVPNEQSRAQELQAARAETARQNAEYEAAVAADLARQAATPASTGLVEPTTVGPQLEEEDEIQQAIAMSLADTANESAAGAPATTPDMSANHPVSATSAEDFTPATTGAATGTTAADQDWTALSPEELRAARLARFG